MILMKTILRCLALSLLAAPSLSFSSPAAATEIKNKEEAVASIEKRKAEMIKLSDQIWAFAETALRERKSSKALADYAETEGFKVERGVAGMPTAFIATYGQGRPIIGVLGEFDALPGISQKAAPVKEPLEAGAPGHGCGHNLFGVASLGAAIAVKELMAAGKLKGTIRFYGTPAEEAGSGKAYMARDGLFKDLDVCLAWHPATETQADVDSTQALVDFIVDSKRAGVEPVLQRLRDIAEGAGRIAGVESKFTIQSGCYEILVNLAGAKLLQQNLEWLGPIKYTEQEQEFARAIQRATGTEQKGLNGEIKSLKAPKPDPPGGSTDVGDVSWIVPTLHFSVTTAPESAWHAWPVVACGGMSIGHKGMIHAAKTLAATMVDLFEDAKTREAIQAEFMEKTKGFVYKPYISDGPPPVPKE